MFWPTSEGALENTKTQRNAKKIKHISKYFAQVEGRGGRGMGGNASRESLKNIHEYLFL